MIHHILDCIGIIGILMLGAGLYLISPVWMLTVIGTLFISFSLLGEAGTLTIRFKKKQGN